MSKVMITSGLALLLSLSAAPTAWADPDTQEPAVVVVEADAGREERRHEVADAGNQSEDRVEANAPPGAG